MPRMASSVTLTLDPKLERRLTEVCRRTGRSQIEVIADALERQLSLLLFEDLREKVTAAAGRAGYQTDEDVFRDVS
jgi:predicted transcriptional regulator